MINAYDVWFSNIDISDKCKIELLNKFSSKEIWNFSEKNFIEIGILEQNSNRILEVEYKRKLDKYLKYIENKAIKVISFKDKKYPNKLKNISDMPPFLYVRGDLENLYSDNIAIIGSRDASEYGKFVARKIAKQIADKNINIVSGLAIGIDKFAHLGALDSKIGKTIAVLGTGVSEKEVYPLENKKIFDKILENNGTIVSEFKLGTSPNRYNFPKRNRIISGLSEKIVVVEAKDKSGSLITVDYALEQGKDVFAVPGNITSKNSEGTNKLIQEGAFVLNSYEDIL